MNEMGNVLETIYDLLLHPRAGMRAVVAERTVPQAFCVVGCCALLFGLALFGGGGVQVALAAVFACEAMLNWLAFTAVWHLIAALFGADGQVRDLLKATGFAHILQALFVPALFLVSLFLAEMAWLGVVLALLMLAWSLYLLVLALCEVYQIGRGKALLVLFAPLLCLLALLFVVFLSAGSYVFMLLQQSDALLKAPLF